MFSIPPFRRIWIPSLQTIITAGGKNETTWEDTKPGYGIFTKTFLDTLGNNFIVQMEIILASNIKHCVKRKYRSKQKES